MKTKGKVLWEITANVDVINAQKGIKNFENATLYVVTTYDDIKAAIEAFKNSLPSNSNVVQWVNVKCLGIVWVEAI